jgi:hypothetical protein
MDNRWGVQATSKVSFLAVTWKFQKVSTAFDLVEIMCALIYSPSPSSPILPIRSFPAFTESLLNYSFLAVTWKFQKVSTAFDC